MSPQSKLFPLSRTVVTFPRKSWDSSSNEISFLRSQLLYESRYGDLIDVEAQNDPEAVRSTANAVLGLTLAATFSASVWAGLALLVTKTLS